MTGDDGSKAGFCMIAMVCSSLNKEVTVRVPFSLSTKLFSLPFLSIVIFLAFDKN